MRKTYTFKNHLKESLKDPEFKKEWEKSEVEYQLACQIIEKRLARKMSQRELAKKAKTTQSVICQIETMNANPTISLLTKIAKAFGSQLQVSIQ